MTTKFFAAVGQKLDNTRIFARNPTTDKYDIGGKKFEVTRSSVYYVNDAGSECEILLEAPRNFCYGVNPDYNDKRPEGASTEKSVKYLTGYQTCYLMTDKDRVENPTNEEKIFKENIDLIVDVAFAKGLEECDNIDTILPGTVTGSFEQARKRKNKNLAIRPVYNHPKNKDTGEVDPSKPTRMYVKLQTRGKGEQMRVQTPYYLPGDVKKNPVNYVDTRGYLTPIFEIKGITWGGKKFAAGMNMSIYEANYEPQTDGQNTQRFGRRNTAIPQEEEAEVAEDGEDEGFAQPEGSNPMDDLNNAGGSSSSTEEEEVAEVEEPPKVNKAAIAAKKAAADKKRAALLAKKKAAK